MFWHGFPKAGGTAAHLPALLIALGQVSERPNLQHSTMTASVIQKLSTDVIAKVNVCKSHCNFTKLGFIY